MTTEQDFFKRTEAARRDDLIVEAFNRIRRPTIEGASPSEVQSELARMKADLVFERFGLLNAMTRLRYVEGRI